jgi:hypothetical protein
MPGYRRLTSFALLLTLCFWASGAAYFLHNQLEHASARSWVSDAAVGASAVESPNSSGGDDHPANDGRHHGHDDCPTCQVLASLKADSGSFATPMLQGFAPSGEVSAARDESATTSPQISLPPARAPPAVHT